MTDYSENEESPVSDSTQQGGELSEAVRETVEHWVTEESIAVERDGTTIVADETELIKNISIMVAIALAEAAE
jgi:hypothetical protein